MESFMFGLFLFTAAGFTLVGFLLGTGIERWRILKIIKEEEFR